MEQQPPLITYQSKADPELKRPVFSMHGLIAVIAAVMAIGFVAILTANAMPRAGPLLLAAIVFSSLTSILGTIISLLERRRSQTFAISALVLTATMMGLIVGTGVGAYLLRAVRRMFL